MAGIVKLKKKELTRMCDEIGINSQGTRNELIERLKEFQIREKEIVLDGKVKEIEKLIKEIKVLKDKNLEKNDTAMFNVTLNNPLSRDDATAKHVQTCSVEADEQALRNTTHSSTPNITSTTTQPQVTTIPPYQPATYSFTPSSFSTHSPLLYTPPVPTSYAQTTSNFIPHITTPHHVPFQPTLPTPMKMNIPHIQTGFCNVRDIISVLPDFDPLNGSCVTSKQYIQRITQLKDAYEWDDRILLFAIQSRLKGPAKLWIDSCEVFSSWKQFTEQFLIDFPTNTNEADVHLEMIETKRTLNENLEEYYFKMLAIGRKGYLPDKVIIKYILRGINDIDFTKIASVGNYSHCFELLNAIRHYNSNLPPVKQFTFSKQINKNNFNSKNTNEVRVSNNVKRNDNKQLVCYNCFNTGHVSLRCPEPQRRPRCENCLRTNHKTDECKEPKRVINKNYNINDFKSVKNVITEVKDPIIKTIRLNGDAIQAFIDSGSNRSLIKQSIASKYGDFAKCNLVLHGFAGGSFTCDNKIKVNLKIDGDIADEWLYLVRDDLIDNDILLGRDILCREGRRMVIEDQEFRIEQVPNVNISDNLTEIEKQKITTLLSKHRNCFATSVAELGKCSTEKMKIHLKSAEPVSMKPYRLPFSKRPVVENIISDLLKADIIRPSESEYSSPIILVEKNATENRLCVDYRRLNKITIKQPFPMPNLEDQFIMLGGKKYFTKLDLKMGYHQIELDEDSKRYTGFVTHDGHYEYNRMPFGLVNAPSVFQNIMNKLICQFKPRQAIAYLDDIVLPSNTFEEGLDSLDNFFQMLSKSGLTVRPDKCQFMMNEIPFLGHVVSQKGIFPGQKKVTAIQNFKPPTNVTEVRRFLGLTGFFRKFVKDYAIIAAPITRLLRKTEQKFQWDVEQQEAFHSLVNILCNSPVLEIFDFEAQHEIHSDASAVGLAGVLLQSHDGKDWKAVAYYSRHCTDQESRYHSYELEVLAAVESLDRFRVYILGKHIKLVTDCSAIAKLKETSEINHRIARWFLRLLEYDIETVHRSGSKLTHVDAMSRAPDELPQDTEVAGLVFQIQVASDDWVYTLQLRDDKVRFIINVLQGNLKSPQEKQIKQEYMLKNHRLFRKVNNDLKLVIPKAVRWKIVQHCHEKYGHFGVDKTSERIRQHYWFPKINKYVKEYIKNCVECCYYKNKPGKTEGRLHIDEVYPMPFYQIHIDHLGPFIRSKKGNTHIIAISDAFSKYLIVKAVRTTKTTPVINVLNEISSYFGLPKRIVTDRGTAFTSKVFEEYCLRHHIQHIKTAVRTPRANGQVERANSTILSYLRTSTTDNKSWDEVLNALQFSINSQKNDTTGICPNELVFKFKISDPIANCLLTVVRDRDENEETSCSKIEDLNEQALKNLSKAREKWKTRFDNKHSIPSTYEIGDLIVVHNEAAATGESRKLEPKFKGPYIVTRILGRDRYLIEDIPGMKISGRTFCSVYSTDKMKPWCGSTPDLDIGRDEEESDGSDGESGTIPEQERPSCHR